MRRLAATLALAAAGLRNPFRFSFDRGSGDLLIGDVGQSRREEIDWVRYDDDLGRGGNFGWPCFEGFATGPRACSAPDYIEPIHDYSQGSPRAVAGGVVVRDPALPSLTGRYVYADTSAGDIRSIVLGRSAADDRSAGMPTRSKLVAFGEDACGHVYVVAISGTVERVQDGAPGACVLTPDPRPLPGFAPPPGPDGRRSARRRRKRAIAVLTILARDAAGNQRRVARRIVVPRR